MLIDNILNGLGADPTHRGGSYSSSGTSTAPAGGAHRSGGTTSSRSGQVSYWDNSAELEAKRQQQAAQQPAAAQQSTVSSFDFAPYVATYGGDSNNKAIRVYVGSTPNVISITASSRSGNYSDVARQALTSFLQSYNQAQIDAEIAANGIDKPLQTSGRSGAGSYSKTDAQIQYDNLSAQVAQMLFENALAANKVVTLQDVLASANPETRSFYVPEGFWYIGDQPSATTNTGTGYGNGTGTGYGNGTGNGNGNGNTEDDSNTMIWLLLPILAMFGAKMMKNNKQKNSRKKR